MPELRVAGRTVAAEAIVFDKDGVLEDFFSYWGAVTEERARQLGLGADRDPEGHRELCALLGYPDGTVDPDGPLVLATAAESAILAAGFLFRRQGIKWVDARARVRAAFAEAYRKVPPEALRACAGVLPALAALRGRGWRIGVATTDAREHACLSLAQLGLDSCVDALVGGDEVSRGKPDPEMYRLICERLGVPPEATIVVGDGVNDLLMGRNAGCVATIGVLSGVSDREALEAAADLILDGAADLLAITS